MATALLPAIAAAAPTAFATTAGTAAAATAAGSFIGPVTAAQSAAGTLSLVSPILQAGGGLFSAFSAYQGGQAESAALRFQARNQELQAKQQELKGRKEALAIRDSLRRTLAAQNAAFAARGIQIGSGTPRNFEISSTANAFNDIDAVRFGADLAELAAKGQGAQFRSSASAARKSGIISAIEKGYSLL